MKSSISGPWSHQAVQSGVTGAHKALTSWMASPPHTLSYFSFFLIAQIKILLVVYYSYTLSINSLHKRNLVSRAGFSSLKAWQHRKQVCPTSRLISRNKTRPTSFGREQHLTELINDSSWPLYKEVEFWRVIAQHNLDGGLKKSRRRGTHVDGMLMDMEERWTQHGGRTTCIVMNVFSGAWSQNGQTVENIFNRIFRLSSASMDPESNITSISFMYCMSNIYMRPMASRNGPGSWNSTFGHIKCLVPRQRTFCYLYLLTVHLSKAMTNGNSLVSRWKSRVVPKDEQPPGKQHWHTFCTDKCGTVPVLFSCFSFKSLCVWRVVQ